MLITQYCIPKASMLAKQGIRKDSDLGTWTGTGIGMQCGKGKETLIKHYILGYINTPFFWIQTFESFVGITITEKDTLLGAKLKFP